MSAGFHRHYYGHPDSSVLGIEFGCSVDLRGGSSCDWRLGGSMRGGEQHVHQRMLRSLVHHLFGDDAHHNGCVRVGGGCEDILRGRAGLDERGGELFLDYLLSLLSARANRKRYRSRITDFVNLIFS